MQHLMEHRLNLWNLKKIKPGKLFFLLFCLALLPVTISFKSEQKEWTFLRTVPTPPVHKTSIDRYFNFYIADNKGNLFKFDSLGNEVAKFSPPKKADITLVEAWRAVNVFVFYRQLQEYNFLDRFLTSSTPNFKFANGFDNNDEGIGFARLATVAYDNNLWIFDDTDFSLKKYDTQINQITIKTSLDLILDPKFYDLTLIREYQNLLFINDKNSGILVFDNMGNYKHKLEFKDVNYFNFIDNYIYFLQKDKMVIVDLYKGSQKEYPLPQAKNYQYILLSYSMAYIAGNDFVDIYKFDFK